MINNYQNLSYNCTIVSVRYALRAPLRPLVVTNIYNDPVFASVIIIEHPNFVCIVARQIYNAGLLAP
jgi:hypothetical protein